MQANPKNQTIKDIAKLAGVSESTVSRALRGSNLVNQKTRDKIKEIADSMDFRVNPLARSLRTQKSHTIGVVMVLSSKEDQTPSDPFVLGLVGKIADELDKRNYNLLLTSFAQEHLDRALELIKHRQVDGLIFFGQGDNIEVFNKHMDGTLPIVVWGEKDPNNQYITVGSDNFSGGMLATEHLLDHKRKRICFAGHLSFETNQRYLGYQQALKNREIFYNLHIDMHFTFADAFKITNGLIVDGSFPFDGVVCASDTIALGMIKALNEANINVPEQVMLVGYDDIEVSEFTSPSLTTIRQSTHKGGALLVDSLIKKMDGDNVKPIVMSPELIERQSTLLDN